MDLLQISNNLQKNLEALHPYTSTPGAGTTRLPFTTEARSAVDAIRGMMEETGLSVREDEAGNIMGTLKGEDPSLASLVIGSHFDTVSNGGNFDGLAGIMTGIEVARLIKESGVTLKRNLVIAGFHDEEGMRFGTGYFGSKALLGQVSQEDLHSYKDRNDISIYDAMKTYGLVPENLPKAAWDIKKIRAYIEMHIEQGPVLYQSHEEIGLVECIVGIQRYIITVQGRSDHAGTTPMDMRIDAMETAAQVIAKLPAWAREIGEGTVATTGFIKATPGGMNIVAGEVQFSVDVRSRNNGIINEIIEKIRWELDEACKKNGASFTMENKLTISPVELNRNMLFTLEQHCKDRGYSFRRMASGAGHDALAIGHVLDTVMVFVPSKDGRSHCPEEWTEYRDIAKSVVIIYDLIRDMQVV
ncbi:MAG: M20 family metallo-hydrolase [Treponema sp.]|jgi:allantoate deiminase|nr:M20 family metallo-hydrolase [Treponema sp.]